MRVKFSLLRNTTKESVFRKYFRLSSKGATDTPRRFKSIISFLEWHPLVLTMEQRTHISNVIYYFKVKHLLFHYIDDEEPEILPGEVQQKKLSLFYYLLTERMHSWWSLCRCGGLVEIPRASDHLRS